MKPLAASIILIIFFTSCHNNTDKATKVALVKTDTANYYQLVGFFQQQVEYVDLRDFVIRYSHVIDNQKDSARLTKEMFIKWGKVFEQQAKQFQQNRQLYKENVFEDLSTESFTLNYSPLEQHTGIQNIDVLLDKVNHNAKRVMMKLAYTKGDTSIIEQYNWKADASFQLIISKKAGTKFSSSEVTYVTWDEKK